MTKKDMKTKVYKAIQDFKEKHQEEQNPIVIITAKKTIFGTSRKHTIVGTERDWRAIVNTIRKGRETFETVEVLEQMNAMLDKCVENHCIHSWEEIK